MIKKTKTYVSFKEVYTTFTIQPAYKNTPSWFLFSEVKLLWCNLIRLQFLSYDAGDSWMVFIGLSTHTIHGTGRFTYMKTIKINQM